MVFMKKILWRAIQGGCFIGLYNLITIYLGIKPLAISIVNLLFAFVFGIKGVLAVLIWEFLIKNMVK